MKYQNEIIINLPVGRVVELFDNPDNMKHWQPSLISFELISGKQGQPGAKSSMKHKMGKGVMEMIETVTVRDLPREFSGTYEAKGVYNEVQNFFSEIEGGKTRYVSVSYFKFTNLMMKVVGFLMPGAFKKQSQKYLADFKAFAEAQGA